MRKVLTKELIPCCFQSDLTFTQLRQSDLHATCLVSRHRTIGTACTSYSFRSDEALHWTDVVSLVRSDVVNPNPNLAVQCFIAPVLFAWASIISLHVLLAVRHLCSSSFLLVVNKLAVIKCVEGTLMQYFIVTVDVASLHYHYSTIFCDFGWL